jgi:uncharacterized protein (DUF2252 family)
MTKRNICDRIQKFNTSSERNSIPQLLEDKYKAMRENQKTPKQNPFVFFRATCHLFYEDLEVKSWFKKAPLAWISGDLHIENFGNYKASNRHVYFDINDFDEAILAPATWEIARVLTSIFVASKTFSIEESIAETLCQQFLNGYVKALETGTAYWLGADTAPEAIAELLSRKTKVKRKEVLGKYTNPPKDKQKRKIDLACDKVLPISAKQREKVESFMEAFAVKQPNPEFFKLLDVAQRIAGTGSLGIERYVLLVEGEGSPDENYLLDLKRSISSSLKPYAICTQPTWENEADRIVSIQRRSQAMPIAFLEAVTIGNDSFVLRELQSTNDPTDYLKVHKWDDDLTESMELMRTLGQVVAWSHLRSSGRQGAAIADELIFFAEKSKWQTEVLQYAKEYCKQVEADWKEFCGVK